MIGFYGSAGFLVIAGCIGIAFQVRRAWREVVEALTFTPPKRDPAIAEDDQVAELDDLYYSPAYGEARS